MKLLQTYYTSCKIGQNGSSGFQYYAFSDGITNEELDEIGKLGNYSAPYGSNPFPTKDEVINVLPIAFKYFRLSSGRVGVLQSTACTQEYTGRPGNFFTHALLLEKGEFPFLPILLHRNKMFRHDLTDEQKNINSIPPLLPALNFDESSLSSLLSGMNDLSIQQFIRQGKNEELLSKMLDIILSGKWEKKPIILAENKPEEIIFALSKALPFENVLNLTFSTYSINPENQHVALSASSYSDSDFNFDDPNKKFEYYVFNRVNGKYPELEEQSELSKILIRLLASEPQKINELYAFSNNFNGTKDSKSMDSIASIFSKQNFESKWKQILPFVTGNAKPEYVNTFLSEYEDMINHLSSILQTEDEIYTFFENLLSLIHRAVNKSYWLKIYFTLYSTIIKNRLNSSTQSLIEFNKRILSIFKGEDRENFKKFFISNDTFTSLAKSAHTELSCMNVFVLILSSIKILLRTIENTDIFSYDSIIKIIQNVDEDKISADSFHILTSEMSDEMNLLLLGIVEVKANSLTKRIIHELFDENNMASFYKLVAQGVFDNSAMSDDICEDVVNLLEKKALTAIPTEKDLKVYSQFGKWIDNPKYQAIRLIMSRSDIPNLIEQMTAFKDVKKLAVFLEWKQNVIFPNLKQAEDWKKFYTLTQTILFETLNIYVKKYFEQTDDLLSLIALIIFSHEMDNKQMDDLLRQILSPMKHSAYNILKGDITNCKKDVQDYFISLNNSIKIKRLFNFKF